MNPMPRFNLVEGDTGPMLEVSHVISPAGDRPPVLAQLDDGYTCWFAAPGTEPPILRQVTAKNEANTSFLAIPTPAETAALGVGIHIVGVELRNPTLTPPLIREKQFKLGIYPSVVSGGTPTPTPTPTPGLADFSDPNNGALAVLLLMEDF